MSVSKPQRSPKIRDPFMIGVRKPAWTTLLYPSTVGTISGIGLAVIPQLTGNAPDFLEHLPKSINRLPRPVTLAVVGFAAGYLGTKTLDWVRWKLIQRLFAYQGWVHGGKSLKTKAWALMLKLLKGPNPHSTYDFQRFIPKQPLPELDQTLDKWLEVAAELVSKEELEQTKDAVEQFRKNEGPKLQAHLKKKYKNEVNWLSEYWLTIAYLAGRDPICVNSNYFVMNKIPVDNLDQLDRAAGCIRVMLEFYEMITQSKLPPVELQELVPLCMNGYRYIYGTTRLPGEHIDRLQRYPGETHIIVIRNGHYYAMEVFKQGPKNKRRILTAREIRNQLERICQNADAMAKPLPVASLTAQNRTKWAKQREILAINNADTLKCVESAMFAITLQTEDPKDIHDYCRMSLTGYGGDRWYDKSFTSICYPSGVYGANVEHSGIDATVFVSQSDYQMVNEAYCKDGLMPSDEIPDTNLPPPLHLSWDLDNLAEEIKQADTQFKEQADNVDLHIMHTKYGKGFMKKCRLSPDGYVQMSYQLAYYMMHNETPKTYEPSTSRLYALGRTENIHPMTAQSKAWVKAMLNPECTNQTRQELLRKAIGLQTKARLAATTGGGCDKHLVGLYCASQELGMDVPAIFMDKPWRMPFKLSTSQTPTPVVELGANVDYKWVLGGFGPVCHNGYGLCYVFLGDAFLNICITTFKSCEETNAKRLADSIDMAMEKMKALFAQ